QSGIRSPSVETRSPRIGLNAPGGCMLINNWYVAAWSSDVGEAPYHSRMLGLDFVLFRDREGGIRCVSDVCIHRGGALHRGQVTDGCITCPYHGWEFDAEGRCVKIPAMG